MVACKNSSSDFLPPFANHPKKVIYTSFSLRNNTETRFQGCTSTLCRLYLESWGQFWVPQQRRHLKLLQIYKIVRWGAKLVKGLRGKAQELQLRTLGWFSWRRGG